MSTELANLQCKQNYMLGRQMKRAHYMSKLAFNHFQQIPAVIKEPEQMNAILKIQNIEKRLKELNKEMCHGAITLDESKHILRHLQHKLSKNVFTVVFMLAERARIAKYLDSI